MKEMNRREFLTLSGAAVVALSLAGCSGGPSAPPAPPASESKELALLRAINEVWYEVHKPPIPKLQICKLQKPRSVATSCQDILMEYFREHEMLDAAVDGRMTILAPDGTAR